MAWPAPAGPAVSPEAPIHLLRLKGLAASCGCARHVRHAYPGTARSEGAGPVSPLAGCSLTLAPPKAAVQDEEPEDDRQLHEAVRGVSALDELVVGLDAAVLV